MVCNFVERMQLLVGIPIIHDTFKHHFTTTAPEVFIFDRFNQVFWWTFLQAPRRWFTNGHWCFARSQNIINFWWERNPFLIFSEANLQKRIRKSPSSSGFIRFPHMVIHHVHYSENPNGFGWFEDPFASILLLLGPGPPAFVLFGPGL